MKTMKNKITVFLAAFLMCVVFVPAVKAKAASLYAGGAVTGLTQTDIKSDSATIQWNAAQGAKGYLIYGYASGSYYLVSETTNTSISLPGSNIVDQQIVVVPYDAESQEHISDAGCWGWITISTLPKKVTGVKYYKPYASSNELSVIWDDEACLGFEAICYDKNGKKVIQKIDTTTYHSADFLKANTQNIYQVKIKPYVVINGNQKVYGPTSSTFYAVPQPKITSTNSDVHSVCSLTKKY